MGIDEKNTPKVTQVINFYNTTVEIFLLGHGS